MKSFKYLIYMSLLILLISCNAKESSPLVTEKIEEITPSHFNFMDSIKIISAETKSWKLVDKFYKKKVAHVTNDELINHTIFWLFNPNTNFISDASIETFEFYLNEAAKVKFNRNLRLIVQMLHKVDSKWNDQKMADYSQIMYDKNMEYWHAHFPNQSVYLEKNQEALATLLEKHRK